MAAAFQRGDAVLFVRTQIVPHIDGPAASQDQARAELGQYRRGIVV